MNWQLEQQLTSLRERAVLLQHQASEATASYEEARLFLDRAGQRLSPDHPLHPLSYNGLVTPEYIAELAKAFEEQELQGREEVEEDRYVAIEEVVLPDDYKGFDVSEWNKKAFDAAAKAESGDIDSLKEQYENSPELRGEHWEHEPQTIRELANVSQEETESVAPQTD